MRGERFLCERRRYIETAADFGFFGSVLAKMGHPEPFNVQFIEVGNEDILFVQISLRLSFARRR